MTQDYYGTKRVTAWHLEEDGKPCYGVKYADGYISRSPKGVFESAYQPLNALNFGHAFAALKDGHKLRRKSWLEDRFIQLQGHYIEFREPSQTAGPFPAWLPEMGDILADDWAVVE